MAEGHIVHWGSNPPSPRPSKIPLPLSHQAHSYLICKLSNGSFLGNAPSLYWHFVNLPLKNGFFSEPVILMYIFVGHLLDFDIFGIRLCYNG